MHDELHRGGCVRLRIIGARNAALSSARLEHIGRCDDAQRTVGIIQDPQVVHAMDGELCEQLPERRGWAHKVQRHHGCNSRLLQLLCAASAADENAASSFAKIHNRGSLAVFLKEKLCD